jgi:hypothetical protein
MMLLATARYIIKNRSSLSDTALGFNPVDYTFILGPYDPVFSTDGMGQPPPTVVQTGGAAAAVPDPTAADPIANPAGSPAAAGVVNVALAEQAAEAAAASR